MLLLIFPLSFSSLFAVGFFCVCCCSCFHLKDSSVSFFIFMIAAGFSYNWKKPDGKTLEKINSFLFTFLLLILKIIVGGKNQLNLWQMVNNLRVIFYNNNNNNTKLMLQNYLIIIWYYFWCGKKFLLNLTQK